MAKQRNSKLKVLSLFSGIGGLDIGFEKAGLEIVATVEWDQDCCDTLRANKNAFLNKNTKIIQADMTKIQPKDIYKGKVDFFIGGPPCQTFSAIGRRAGGASGRLDDRGNLFEQYCRLLKYYSPIGFMFENVRGILSSNNGQDWKDILAEFSSLGYQLKYRVLDTAGYGVAQHRERVILVGCKIGHNFLFPRPIHGIDSRDNKKYVTPVEALKGVEHAERIEALFNKNGKYDDLLAEIPPGSNYLFYTEEMGHPEPKFAWRSKFSDFLYKADPNLPVKTIVARMGRYSGPFHWNVRKLSIGELLRLQGFPDGYMLCGGRTSKIRQIGNSVVPQFAYYLALAVRKTIFSDESTKLDLLNDDEMLSIDKRKSVKAKNTRNRRIVPEQARLSLFNILSDHPKPIVQLDSANYFLRYDSPSAMKFAKKACSQMEFKLTMSIQDSDILVSLKKKGTNFKRNLAFIELSINSNAFSQIKKLKMESNWYDPARPYVLWDSINVAIASISPFPSIHELYGHFTEPNPKFRIECFELSVEPDSIAQLLIWMSNMQNTTRTHPISILTKMGFNIRNQKDLLVELRNKRIDIRTNLTNNRIAKEEFRICYPYTLPIDKKNFVTIT